jgi:hypothetical protein
VNKNGQVITSAVTTLDLHDIARAGKTYGVSAFYVVTPLEDQKKLTGRFLDHWITGGGASYNPNRGEALDLIRIKDRFQDVVDEITDQEGIRPLTVFTSARAGGQTLSYRRFREMLAQGRPHVLVFGTAWGLSGDFMAEADAVLEPVNGGTDYNHLSVRSAAAIILDRVLWIGEKETLC